MGVAAGLGLSLVLACDMAIATDTAKFGALWVRRGLIPDGGATYFLPKLVGKVKSLEMMLTGDIVDAQEAERIGLVSRVVAADKLMLTANELAGKIARGPAVALEITKRAVYKGMDSNLDSAVDFELWGQHVCYLTEDHKEAIAAFQEKRDPVVQGKVSCLEGEGFCVLPPDTQNHLYYSRHPVRPKISGLLTRPRANETRMNWTALLKPGPLSGTGTGWSKNSARPTWPPLRPGRPGMSMPTSISAKEMPFCKLNTRRSAILEIIDTPWKISGLEKPDRHAPLLGEHNDYVLKELLGMSDEEVKALQEKEVIMGKSGPEFYLD